MISPNMDLLLMNCNTSQKCLSVLRKGHVLPQWPNGTNGNPWIQPHHGPVGIVRFRRARRRRPKHKLNLIREENGFPACRQQVESGAQVQQWPDCCPLKPPRREEWCEALLSFQFVGSDSSIGTAVCQELHCRKGLRNNYEWIGLEWALSHLTSNMYHWAVQSLNSDSEGSKAEYINEEP